MSCETWRSGKCLKEMGTFGIGGPALYHTEVYTIEEMRETIRTAKQKKIPYLVLGKGSNCLFNDKGFHGLVILNKIDYFENPSPGVFHVGAGYSFSLLGVQTARQKWSGLEFASGIPASVGGAIFMNAGANGKETSEFLTSVEFVNEDSELVIFERKDLNFKYRHSSFQTMKGAIVGATFTLTPSLEARQKQIEIIHYRTKTQPYGDRSAGCIFRNPEGHHAGALIDKAGLKGTSIGGAQVSQLHANFIVNVQEATSQDVLNLISLIQKRVKESTGIELESEIKIIPYFQE